MGATRLNGNTKISILVFYSVNSVQNLEYIVLNKDYRLIQNKSIYCCIDIVYLNTVQTIETTLERKISVAVGSGSTHGFQGRIGFQGRVERKSRTRGLNWV